MAAGDLRAERPGRSGLGVAERPGLDGGHRLELPSTTTLTWRDIPVVQGENRIEVALDRLEGQDCLRIEGIELVIAYI